MRSRIKRPWFVWLLLLCLVLVNGFMAAPGVGHAEHHATHKAGTHTTGICAWFCAAGQGVESSSVSLVSVLQEFGRSGDLTTDPLTLLFFTDVFSRGPPALAF